MDEQVENIGIEPTKRVSRMQNLHQKRNKHKHKKQSSHSGKYSKKKCCFRRVMLQIKVVGQKLEVDAGQSVR